MLSTIPIKNQEMVGGDNIQHSIIKKMANETVIEEGIRNIEEKSSVFHEDSLPTNPIHTEINKKFDITKSFHNMESKIFSKLGHENSKILNDSKDQKISNFDLSEITKKYGGKTPNILGGNKKLMISMNENQNKFIVSDVDGTQIGYFTIEHIIKYLSDPFDTKNQVLTELDEKTYHKSKELIKSLICKMMFNKKNGYVSIIIIDHTQSGFMADIELLVKLNDMLYKYQEDELNNILSNVDKSARIKIEKNIKKFIYLLLNYTLKLIALISDKLKDTEDKKELKQNLIKYSASLVYRISTFVQGQLKIFDEQNKSIKQLLKYNLEMKEDIKDKIDKILEQMQENQNRNPLKTSKFSEI